MNALNALIVVDIQPDFLPGGALAVTGGDEIIPLINHLQECFELVIATQDWHPEVHKSFAANHENKQPGEIIDLNGLPQVLWPVHCVMGSEGAVLAPALETDKITAVFRKGTNPEVDSYSGFFDNGRRVDTGLATFLREKGVSRVFIVGLATDYCVKYSAMDAAALGFDTHLIIDACRGVELQPGDISAAIREMEEAGVKITGSAEVFTAKA